MLFASPHYDRDSLLEAEQRTHGTAATFVTGHGDVSAEDAEIIARDLAIADAFASNNGLGCMEAGLFDQIDTAMNAQRDPLDPEPLAPFFVANTFTTDRLGRAWDRLCRYGRALWAWFCQPTHL